MSYPAEITPENIPSLLAKREFFSARIPSEYDHTDEKQQGDPNFSRGYDEFAGQYMKIRPHQHIVSVLMSPHIQNKSICIVHSTGSGKTLSFLRVAMEFIPIYKQVYQLESVKRQKIPGYNAEMDRVTPSIFVLGFAGAKTSFIRDLLKYPEFGFITHEEREELNKKLHTAGSRREEDIKAYKDYYSWIKRRITNKERGGFFKFYGYAEFVNALFITDENTKLTTGRS
jgi:hypothetical protein